LRLKGFHDIGAERKRILTIQYVPQMQSLRRRGRESGVFLATIAKKRDKSRNARTILLNFPLKEKKKQRGRNGVNAVEVECRRGQLGKNQVIQEPNVVGSPETAAAKRQWGRANQGKAQEKKKMPRVPTNRGGGTHLGPGKALFGEASNRGRRICTCLRKGHERANKGVRDRMSYQKGRTTPELGETRILV